MTDQREVQPYDHQPSSALAATEMPSHPKEYMHQEKVLTTEVPRYNEFLVFVCNRLVCLVRF